MSTLFDSIPDSPTTPPGGSGSEVAAPVLRTAATSPALEAHCRFCVASWDGYRGLGGVWQQHFTEEAREYFRDLYRHLFEEPTT